MEEAYDKIALQLAVMLGTPTLVGLVILWASYKNLLFVDALIPLQLLTMAGVVMVILAIDSLSVNFEMRLYQSLTSYSYYVVLILFQTAVWNPI